MPRFFLHIHNGHGLVHDEEGSDAPDQAGARVLALDSIRSIVAEEAREGLIDLTGRIAIEDEDGNPLSDVCFPDAFELRMPANG
ncbi:DUF6894 family protein [Sphingomonas colocasiae]|uniref:DUF6894 domain-containing protein n=1 Tax=Sphingomonas colocasiae TaxID=1848973 RepID=A0ABS7PQ79_9SPHN|nr:hypothetical protein [Sphingomonas colocasiae]MBY8823480.1 hypothetical protein [Sphingomonas colocasiae]